MNTDAVVALGPGIYFGLQMLDDLGDRQTQCDWMWHLGLRLLVKCFESCANGVSPRAQMGLERFTMLKVTLKCTFVCSEDLVLVHRQISQIYIQETKKKEGYSPLRLSGMLVVGDLWISVFYLKPGGMSHGDQRGG